MSAARQLMLVQGCLRSHDQKTGSNMKNTHAGWRCQMVLVTTQLNGYMCRYTYGQITQLVGVK